MSLCMHLANFFQRYLLVLMLSQAQAPHSELQQNFLLALYVARILDPEFQSGPSVNQICLH